VNKRPDDPEPREANYFMTNISGDGKPAPDAAPGEGMDSFLRALPPFDALSPEGLEELIRDARELSATRGQVLFQEGQSSDSVYVVRAGRVRIQHAHKDGTVRIVCMLAPGDAFCCLPALDGGAYPAGAVAADRSTIYRLPAAVFRRLMEQELPFGRQVTQNFCGRLRKASCESCWKSMDAAARLAGRILCMADRFGEEIPLTRRELSELAGTTVETAIRTIKDFERAGWVQLARGRVRVLDRAGLGERAEGANPLANNHVPIPTKGQK